VSGPPETALFIGRLHPLLVHLPIGLIVLLAALELLSRSRRFRNANSSAGFILALAVPLAVFTVVCGWLLSLGGGYQQHLLQWHKWLGIGTAAACCLAALCYWLDLKTLYRCCLFGTVAVLAVASHFGGSLTHGSDYLVRYAPAPLRSLLGLKHRAQPLPINPGDINQLPAFAGLVQPVLEQNCVACHGAEKSEAKLRLDSLAALLKGGKSGPALAPGSSGESLILKRLRLPPDDKFHMPPQGKPPLARDDLALLQWWIENGAPADKKVAELKRPATIARILERRFGAPAAIAYATPPKPSKVASSLAAALSDELGIPITFLAEDKPWLQCNASIAGPIFGDAELSKLSALGPNLRWLDLAGTKITDAGLRAVAAMPNLKRLHLERTAITDTGLARLGTLTELEYLNIYGTAVTDAGLASLQAMPRLRQLYLWQTKVTPAAAKAFAAARTDQDQIQGWRQEIEELEAKIENEKFSVELGTTTVAPASTNAMPANQQCPVSGKPADLAHTVDYQGTVIAFCCKDCKAKFEQDPKPFLGKLGLIAKLPDTNTQSIR
jgi:uncharacterized membrane protein/YHS domain-containing protein